MYNFDNLSAYSQMQKRISLTQDHWRRHLVRKKRKTCYPGDIPSVCATRLHDTRGTRRRTILTKNVALRDQRESTGELCIVCREGRKKKEREWEWQSAGRRKKIWHQSGKRRKKEIKEKWSRERRKRTIGCTGQTQGNDELLSVKRPRHTLLSTVDRDLSARSLAHSLPFFLLLSPRRRLPRSSRESGAPSTTRCSVFRWRFDHVGMTRSRRVFNRCVRRM